MKRLCSRLKTEKGSFDFISGYMILFALVLFTVMFGEYFRLIGLRDEVDMILQRGINVAVETAMRDEERWDANSRMNTALADLTLNNYLRNEIGLDSQYRRWSTDAKMVYQIVFSSRSSIGDPPRLNVRGQILLRPAFPLFPSDIVWAFDISSRNLRLD